MSSLMCRRATGWLSAAALVVFVFVPIPCGAQTEALDFAHDIVPILRKHCGACHLGEKKQGGLSMNTRELLLAGGESGAVVELGQSQRSELVRRVSSDDPGERMPPEGERLSAADVALLRRWIDGGLPWEAGFSFAALAYEPPLHPRRVDLPPPHGGRTHPVDRIVDAYWAEHSVARPPRASDAVFCRRVHLDLIGLLPQPDRLTAFLADPSPDKRVRLVRELLDDDLGYAEHWLTFWNDLLRNDYTGTGFITQGRKQITRWLYDALRHNKPYDQFVHELIAPTSDSEGFIQGIRWRGDVSASQRQELQFAQNISQVFLGINLKCASCHDSFIDRWTLQETYGLAAVYATEPLTLHRCDQPLDQTAQAAWIFPELGQVDPAASQTQRLQQLAALMTHPENGRFTRTLVNRLWQRLLGRGIVHPVDAMHTPPWSADLLDFLAAHLADHDYDLKATLELICTSETYQAATPAWPQSTETAAYLFRGPEPRRMTAEQFVDAVWQVTGAAPLRYDAAVIRAPLQDEASSASSSQSEARWIWSQADPAGAPAGEMLTWRRQFDLAEAPAAALAVVTADNSYQLFVNENLVAADENWETVELVALQPFLKQGPNEILITVTNGGSSPNPAGLIFEARLRDASGTPLLTIATDVQWHWTRAKLDRRGRFRQPPQDWQPAVVIADPSVWSERVDSQLMSLIHVAADAPLRMVRASLVKSDALMRSLGRPNRDQVVTSRPSELTTLEAIELANGDTLAEWIAQGAVVLSRQHPQARELVTWLYAAALTRPPTADEAALAEALLGDGTSLEAIEDLLWAVMMLPEFQLVR